MEKPERDPRGAFRGALIGLGVGDALEADREARIALRTSSRLSDLIPERWTDDTEMNLCVVESLLTRKVFDPDDIARRFVAWLRSNPQHVGAHTRRVLSAIAAGEMWERASTETYKEAPDQAPNGSLMRCAPLSMFLYRHPDMLVTLSPILSRITHAHPDCEWSCVFVNVLLAWLLLGHTRSRALEEAIAVCEPASHEMHERIDRATQAECRVRPTGNVLDTLEVALWVLLHSPDYETAIAFATDRDSDIDSVGSVTGALAGAFFGVGGIPHSWIEPLQGSQRLVEYADGLLELADSW
jgi:ADP-ribosyl-[dinitrogen reductase] hydrolase